MIEDLVTDLPTDLTERWNGLLDDLESADYSDALRSTQATRADTKAARTALLEELSRLKAGEGEIERGRLECVTAILHALAIEDDAELRQFLKDWSEGDYSQDYLDRLAASLPPAPGGSDG